MKKSEKTDPSGGFSGLKSPASLRNTKLFGLISLSKQVVSFVRREKVEIAVVRWVPRSITRFGSAEPGGVDLVLGGPCDVELDARGELCVLGIDYRFFILFFSDENFFLVDLIAIRFEDFR